MGLEFETLQRYRAHLYLGASGSLWIYMTSVWRNLDTDFIETFHCMPECYQYHRLGRFPPCSAALLMFGLITLDSDGEMSGLKKACRTGERVHGFCFRISNDRLESHVTRGRAIYQAGRWDRPCNRRHSSHVCTSHASPFCVSRRLGGGGRSAACTKQHEQAI
jgi:hypothetical protein